MCPYLSLLGRFNPKLRANWQFMIYLLKSLQSIGLTVTFKLKQNLSGFYISHVMVHFAFAFPHTTPQGLFCHWDVRLDHVELPRFGCSHDGEAGGF